MFCFIQFQTLVKTATYSIQNKCKMIFEHILIFISEHIHSLSTHTEEQEGEGQGPSLRREITVIPTARKAATAPVGLAHIGRPIAQVSHIPDPVSHTFDELVCLE